MLSKLKTIMRIFPTITFVIQFNLLLIINATRSRMPILIGDCMYQHENQTFSEGDTIKIGKRLYKIELCRLERAYQSCSKTLWRMLYVVCAAIDKRKKTRFIRKRRRFFEEKLLTEACCEQACTVSSMTGFCFNL